MRAIFILAFCLSGLAFGVPAPECTSEARFQLEGDGHKSDRVRLWCHNTGKSKLAVEVPQGTVFAHATLQDLMVLETRKLVVPPGGKVQCSLSTMCVGLRHEAPPGAQPTDYRPVACDSHPQGRSATRLLSCAQKLCSQGDFPPLPMLRGAQPGVVAQYALWRDQGMTKEDLRALVLAHTKPKPEDEAEARTGVDNIWESVDLTSKEAARP